MKTSYYQSKQLDSAKHLVVQTSVGTPRWGTQPEWETETINPPASILGLDETLYGEAYVAHLARVGVPDNHSVKTTCKHDSKFRSHR